MRWLKAVIARLIGLLTRTRGIAIALPTPAAGPVSQELMTQLGKAISAMESPQPQLSPAKPASPKKPKAAQRTSAASKSTSKKSKPAATAKSPRSRGSSTQTPAPKTLQPVKQVPKLKQVAVQSTPQEQSPQHEQVHAQTPMANPFGVLGKPKAAASKTHQPALQESKPKPKRAQRTKAASKRTLAKAHAKTRTALPSGAAGS